jgi:hypothetical protein
MPFKSKAQNAWGHTKAGMKALGGKKKVEEWESKTNYKTLPKKAKVGTSRGLPVPPCLKGK